MNIETVIFHRPNGTPEHEETYAGSFPRKLTKEERGRIEAHALKNGMTVRIAEIDLSTPPDFAGTLRA